MPRLTPRPRFAALIFMASLTLGSAMVGCGESRGGFNSVDVSGAVGFASDFRLPDHTGKMRTLGDFRGKVVAMFFGFTHCPDVCPTTLSEMRRVMALLGRDSERFQVLFISVDPKRDTAELLGRYVPSFHPSFLGLVGDAQATAKVASDFKIVYRESPGKTPETYSIDHTAGTLLFDPQGRLRLFVPYGMDAEKLAADIKRLL